MEYNGRQIKAYRIEEYPPFVVIEVVQKESDCPFGLPQEKRRKEYCPLDCGNTLLSLLYDIDERKIKRVGTLSDKTTNWFVEKLQEIRITPEEIIDIIDSKSDKVSFEKGNPGTENILYEGITIGRKTICGFEFGDWIDSNDSEVQLYLNLIAKDPEYIMLQCGINILRDGNLTIMTTRSYKENVRSAKDLGYIPND
jgi:hypothetical protein